MLYCHGVDRRRSLFLEARKCGTYDHPFSISEAVHIMLQVAEGMLFLHEKQIVHRDLKSHNILVKCIKARSGVKFLQAKVADFGLSRTKEKSMTYTNQTQNQGTTRWMAPEMFKIVNDDWLRICMERTWTLDKCAFQS